MRLENSVLPLSRNRGRGAGGRGGNSQRNAGHAASGPLTALPKAYGFMWARSLLFCRHIRSIIAVSSTIF
jgi:hypothetical protein